MAPGIPGTGLGGILYFFWAIIIVIIELTRIIKGKKSKTQPSFITDQIIIIIGTLSALLLTAKFLFFLVSFFSLSSPSSFIPSVVTLVIFLFLVAALEIAIRRSHLKKN